MESAGSADPGGYIACNHRFDGGVHQCCDVVGHIPVAVLNTETSVFEVDLIAGTTKRAVVDVVNELLQGNFPAVHLARRHDSVCRSTGLVRLRAEPQDVFIWATLIAPTVI